VVGFPHGTSKATVKAIEATSTIKEGAAEVDVVAFLPNLLNLDLGARPSRTARNRAGGAGDAAGRGHQGNCGVAALLRVLGPAKGESARRDRVRGCAGERV
jgi:hypothetical protein